MSELFDLILQKPLPDEWSHALLFIAFTFHLLFVLLTLGTAILAFYYFIRAWWDQKLEDLRWDKAILKTFLAHKSLAIVLGVAALLLIQVGSTIPFLTAINHHAASWILIIVFLIIAFLFLDFLGQRIYTHRYIHLVFGIIGTAALLIVPGIFVAVLVTTENPDHWLTMAINQHRMSGKLAIHWLYRYLHVLGASLVFGGLFHYFYAGDEEIEKKNSLLKWVIGGVLIQFLVGVMLYDSLPHRPDLITKICIFAGVAAACLLVWVIISSITQRRLLSLKVTVPILMLILVPMLLARQLIQDKSLIPLNKKLAENAKSYEARIEMYQAEALQQYKEDMSFVYDNGQTIYSRSCAFCHGENGDGKGIEAKNLVVPPEDLSAIRTDREYFRKILVEGVPGTGMPYFSFFDRDKLDMIIDYLDSRHHILSEPKSLPVKVSPAALAQARTIYAQTCSVCHGLDGKGTKLALGMHPPPSDFSRYSLSPERAFEVIRDGYPGTMMSGFKDLISEEIRWGLVQVIYEKRSPPLAK